MGLHTPLEELARWFDRDHFALVCTEQRSYTGGTYSTMTVITGVVTRVDLLSFIATKGGESPTRKVWNIIKSLGAKLIFGTKPPTGVQCCYITLALYMLSGPSLHSS